MNLISAIFTVLTVIVGGVCIMLFVSTKTLRESRDDFAIRIKQLEDERVRDKSELAEKDTAIKFWRSAATGDEKLDQVVKLVVAISTLLTEHMDEARNNWTLVNAGLGHLGTATDHMSDSIDSLVDTLNGEGEEGT